MSNPVLSTVSKATTFCLLQLLLICGISPVKVVLILADANKHFGYAQCIASRPDGHKKTPQLRGSVVGPAGLTSTPSSLGINFSPSRKQKTPLWRSLFVGPAGLEPATT